ncbi:MAG: DNA mismatch repair protein MutS [Gemmatimonadota bacterium]|nr:MAG: DNA mismatch repair protein MutS [Gemmatimonadota bacterium]
MSKTTPMMEQYLSIKRQHQDAILFFRMGDFYETFYEDAHTASKVLGVALTSRSQGTQGRIPLAGIPHHALDTYLSKLLKAGHKVAICEQVEDPKKAKGIVKREVVEVVTPGTALSDGVLKENTNNYLVGICSDAKRYGFATVDISTGEFTVTELKAEDLHDELQRVGPTEIVVPETWFRHNGHIITERFPQLTVSPRDDWTFTYDYARERLLAHFQVHSLRGFGCEELSVGLSAAGAILVYLQETQKGSLSHIRSLAPYAHSEYMVLDAATQRNLELLTSLTGERHGTLLGIFDRTKTPMGARLVRRWLQKPLRSVDGIRSRLDAVEYLVDTGDVRKHLIRLMGLCGDLERLIAKVCTGRANARDIVNLKDSLKIVPELRLVASQARGPLFEQVRDHLKEVGDIVDVIEKTLVDDPPLSLTDGGIIRQGHHSELDELRAIRFHAKDWIAQLQGKERERTKIASLKVLYNRVFGYYIEVTKPNLSKVPEDYVRKQTLVNAERFITPELKEYETKVLGAEERINDLEYELFVSVREQVANQSERIQDVAKAIALSDVLGTVAEVAVAHGYCKPEIHDGPEIDIRDGRHPVVERLLVGETFVPNDTHISTEHEQILVITGPNMAGKSTYLRQVALIVLMAQVGSYVPAKEASIGVVDRIFTRVGATDRLVQGESTFLVEMNEAANILHNATPQSLIILDEIGRGTSTFDGLSIAWAVTEYLHKNPRVAAKTLFATHYHELTELERILPRVKNYNIAVKEWGDGVVFLRKIVEGGCDRSYGIQVARLAGFPPEVIERAKEVLSNLEENELTPNRIPKIAKGAHAPDIVGSEQFDLFASYDSPLLKELEDLDISKITPLEALTKLHELKEKLKRQ